MGTNVQIKVINFRRFPCSMCRFRNSQKFPFTKVHQQQQISKTYLANSKAGQELGLGYQHYGYAEIIGECPDFEKLT